MGETRNSTAGVLGGERVQGNLCCRWTIFLKCLQCGGHYAKVLHSLL